jgi:hypothetical protein
MARSRERGTGSVYLKEDPKHPGQKRSPRSGSA